MSNKTTFKRIALAVVAALGFGVLGTSPSSAVVSNLSVTAVNGTASTTASDTATAAIVTVSGFVSDARDTLVVTIIEDGARPTARSGYTLGTPMVGFLETTSSTVSLVNAAGGTGKSSMSVSVKTNLSETASVGSAAFKIMTSGTESIRDIGAKFTVQLDSLSALTYGTYNYKAVVQAYSHDGATKTEMLGQTTFSITVATPASVTAAASTTVDPTKSWAVLSSVPAYWSTTTTADSAIAVVSTAAATDHATILVKTFNASGASAAESVTATISNAGVLCNTVSAATSCGASLSLTGASGTETLTVRADGRAGVASIVIATTSKTFPAKSITFYSANPATVVPTVEIPVIGIGSAVADVISIDAKDANGSIWGGQAYLFSSDTTIATAGTCSFSAADSVHYCSVTGVKAGQSKFQVGNKSTLAASTVKTDAFDGPRITAGTAATVKVEFDKAAYAPGEKARIYVTPLDADGKTLAAGTVTDALAAGGVTPSLAFSSGSDTTTAVDIVLADANSSTTGAKAGSAMYTVYMPFSKGSITLTAKGGTGLPAAGRVTVTASAEVVDDSVDAAVDAAQEATDAAIAATDAAILAQEAADEAASAAIAAQETAQAAVDAVTALSAEVTKLVAQLATLQKLLNRVAKRVGVKL